MIPEIPVPASGNWWTALCAPVIAMAKAINGLRKLTFKPGADWKFAWDYGGATITYFDSGGGGGGGGLGPCVFMGTAGGEPAFFIVNCDGVAYPTFPAGGYPIANPP